MAASKEGDLGRERWQGGRQQGRSSGRKKDGECGGQRGRRWVMEAADLAALSFPFFTGGWRKGVREWEVGVGWSSWSAGWTATWAVSGRTATWAVSGLLSVFHE